jgi:ATP diphosphatase
LQKRAARVGFDWPDISMVVDKIVEEARELSEAQTESNPDHLAEEYGDLLFVIANINNIDAPCTHLLNLRSQTWTT